MNQEKKPGIAEAITVVEYFYELMLSETDKEPHNVTAIMHDNHEKLISALQHMEGASVAEPEPEPEPQGPTTGDSKNRAGSSSSSLENEAASSRASFGALRAWLEHTEHEDTSANSAKCTAGESSSHGKTATSSTASFATVRAWLEHVEHPQTTASSARAPSSHGNTANNSTKASFASLRRDPHEHDDRSEGGESPRNPSSR